MQTLTWQGAHVVASLGIDAPRTKSDTDGTFTDPETIAALEAFANLMLEVARSGGDTRLALVRAIVMDAGVDANHIAPVV